MTARVDVFFVGCGAFAHRYHVPALVADHDVSVAAVFDPTPSEATRALAQRYGAPIVGRIEELPPAAGLTFALVTTPHTLHTTHIDVVIDRGLHALVDKPFVMRAADAQRLAERAQRRKLHNAVAYNRRFDAGCLRAREIIRSGGIGGVRFIQTVQLGYERAGWFLVPELGGGGPYTGRASHMADLIPWLVGRAPTRRGDVGNDGLELRQILRVDLCNGRVLCLHEHGKQRRMHREIPARRFHVVARRADQLGELAVDHFCGVEYRDEPDEIA